MVNKLLYRSVQEQGGQVQYDSLPPTKAHKSRITLYQLLHLQGVFMNFHLSITKIAMKCDGTRSFQDSVTLIIIMKCEGNQL